MPKGTVFAERTSVFAAPCLVLRGADRYIDAARRPVTEVIADDVDPDRFGVHMIW